LLMTILFRWVASVQKSERNITKESIMFATKTIQTTPFSGQKPGTSGLRKQVSIFAQANYLENFVQSIFDELGDCRGETLVLGGDGRYHNDVAIRTIIKMAAAHGYGGVLIGKDGLLSTPAASLLIRKYQCSGGILLTASHNAGGPNGDFGIKYNIDNGGAAPEALTNAVYARTQTISEYHLACDERLDQVDLSVVGEQKIGELTVTIIDSVKDALAQMETLFDFSLMRRKISEGLSISFDAMHAVTGPYARVIFNEALGVPEKDIINAIPSTDFGGGHPDPNPAYAKELMAKMFGAEATVFGAASDGDGDRHLILGPGLVVSPSDSLAIIAANMHLVPGYAKGLTGVARSMPTSSAVDFVAKRKGVPIYVTPTGWKFFGTLLDANKITLCGEESAGAGSSHVREKDGLWAILMWINILAAKAQTVEQLLQAHWQEYGRHYYTRHDYEGIDSAVASQMYQHLCQKLPALIGTECQGLTIETATNFGYKDPVDGSSSNNQGLIINFSGGGSVVFRLSGTGTVGATLRVYLERYQADKNRLNDDTQTVLADLAKAAIEIVQIQELTGKTAPDVIT
jgi:phosphoglucomutase